MGHRAKPGKAPQKGAALPQRKRGKRLRRWVGIVSGAVAGGAALSLLLSGAHKRMPELMRDRQTVIEEREREQRIKGETRVLRLIHENRFGIPGAVRKEAWERLGFTESPEEIKLYNEFLEGLRSAIRVKLTKGAIKYEVVHEKTGDRLRIETTLEALLEPEEAFEALALEGVAYKRAARCLKWVGEELRRKGVPEGKAGPIENIVREELRDRVAVIAYTEKKVPTWGEMIGITRKMLAKRSGAR